MGRIGEVVEYKTVDVDGDKAVEVTVDLGAGDVVTALETSPSGVWSRPRVGDLALVVELDGAEEYAVVGYIDVARSNTANAGEAYVYSRKTTGDLAGYIYVKNDGAITISNAVGNIRLAADGTVTINGHLTVQKV